MNKTPSWALQRAYEQRGYKDISEVPESDQGILYKLAEGINELAKDIAG